MQQQAAPQPTKQAHLDCVVVGAGFGGLYAIRRLSQTDLSFKVFEAGDGVGGTWYWNRYPGAQCDVPSRDYSYAFSDELQTEWEWSRRYAPQDEILAYINHVAERFDLRKHIQFQTRVVAATFDDKSGRWLIETDQGDRVSARFLIMASGGLSEPQLPDFPGIRDFQGQVFHTGKWPKEPVDFSGKRVGIIGTGSSGIQAITAIARMDCKLFVFQRTPQYVLPAENRPVEPEKEREFRCQHYKAHREDALNQDVGYRYLVQSEPSAVAAPEQERRQKYEMLWRLGGPSLLRAYADIFTDMDANATAAEFVRAKIRQIVRDPLVAEKLTPRDYPIGGRRICIADGYFESFNRPDVSLVDLRKAPLRKFTKDAICVGDREIELDILILATGYDALTGPLFAIDIRGKGGVMLKDAWREGPVTLYGIMTHDFPNMFLVAGPGGPSVFANMVTSIEKYVDWIVELIEVSMRGGKSLIEPRREAQSVWTAEVAESVQGTVIARTNSWWMGSNIAGKPRVFLAYLGGLPKYLRRIREEREDGYPNFELR